MEISKKYKIIISIVFVLAITFGVYLVYKKSQINKIGKTDNNTSKTATTTNIGGVEISSEGSGNYKVERVPVNEGRNVLPQPIPDLSKSLVFGVNVSLSDEAKKILSTKVSDLQVQLKNDPTYVTGWIDLGVYRKMAGDYTGALTSWTYATKLAPDDYISYGNIGDLYAYYIKDNAMAEVSYKKAISNAPDQVYLYVQLATVYRDVFGDMDKAKEIIDQGLKVSPKSKTLLEFKSSIK